MEIGNFLNDRYGADQSRGLLSAISKPSILGAVPHKCGRGQVPQILKIIVVAAIFVLASLPHPLCAQPIYQKEDKFDGSVTFSTKIRDADLEGGSFLSSRYVLLNFIAQRPVTTPDRPYALVVRTRTPEWIFIESGPSLLLKLNGSEMLQLSGEGSSRARHVESGDVVTEMAIYDLTPSELQRISVAKSVDFRIVGDRQLITGTFERDLVSDAVALFARGPELISLAGPHIPAGGAQDGTAVATSIQPAPVGRRVTSNSAPTLGINMVPTPDAMVSLLKMEGKRGLWVLKIVPDGAAARAGLEVGDVLLSGNGKQWDTPADLAATMNSLKAGDVLTLGVWHAYTVKTVSVKF